MLRKVLVALGVLLGAAAALLVLALANLETLVNQYRDDVAQTLSEALSRPVVFGPVRIAWSDGLTAEFTSARVVGRLPEDPPQAEVTNVVFKLDVWKMVRTRGQKLQFSRVTIQRPVLHLRRDGDGGWDFDDILEHLSKQAQAQTEQAPASLEEANEWLQGLEIAGVAIRDGTVFVDDAMNQRKLVVDDVNLDVSRIIPGRDVGATLRLVLDDTRSRAPVEASVHLRPLPVNLDFDEIPNTSALLTVDGLDLDTWGDLVPAEFTRPEAGRLDVHLDASTDHATQVGHFKGRVELHGLELGLKGVRGQSSDAELNVDIDANLQTQALSVKRFDLTGPGLKLTTRMELKEHSVDGIRQAALDLEVADLGRLTGIAPQGSALLPKDLKLQGPFQVRVRGDSDNGNVLVNLDDAAVGWGDAVDKDAGIPLRLDVDAERDATGVNLKDIRLRLQNALVQGNIHVPSAKGAPLTGELHTGDVALGQLAGIFPAAEDRRGKGDKLEGTVRLKVSAAEKHRQQELHAELAMTALDLKVDRASLQGDGSVVVDMDPTGQETREWTGDLKFTDLAVRYSGADGSDVVTKPKGLPAELHLRGARDGATVKMDDAVLKFGQTVVDVAGNWTGVDTKDEVMVITTDRFDLAFDDLRAVSPAARALPPGGTLRARVRASKTALGMRSLKVDVEDLDVDAGKSAVNGSVTFQDALKPEVVVNASTVSLDLTELRKLTGRGEIPEGAVRAAVQLTYDAGHSERFVALVDGIDATVAGSRITGRAHVRDLDAPDLDVQLEADKINVDDIIKLVPPGKEPPRPAENPHGLGKSQRAAVRKVRGAVAVKAGSASYGKYTATGVDVALRAAAGVVTAERLEWKLYGAQCSAKGTTVDLGAESLHSSLALAVRGLDLREVVDAHAEQPGRVGGTADADVNLSASGMTKDGVLATLKGPVGIRSQKIDVRGLNMLGQIFDKLRKTVPLPNPPTTALLAPNRPEPLRHIDVQAAIGGGKVVFIKPVTTDTEFGQLQLDGTVFLDSRLELEGGARLRPEEVGKVLGLTPPRTVLVPVQVGGTWSDPQLTGVDVEGFARELGLGELIGKVSEAVEDAQQAAEAARKQAEAAKAAVDAQAEEARKRAEAARNEVEDKARAARKHAEQAKKDAEAKAEQAKQDAEHAAAEAKQDVEQTAAAAKQDVEQTAAAAKQDLEDAKEAAEAKAEQARKEAESKAEQAKKELDDARREAEEKAEQAKKEAEEKAEEARKELEDKAEKAKDALQDLFE